MTSYDKTNWRVVWLLVVVLGVLLFCAAVVQRSQGASISLSAEPGYIQVTPMFMDAQHPRGYEVRGLDDFAWTANDGFVELAMQNINPAPPPFWTVQSFWVEMADAGFSMQPVFTGIHVNVDLSEFIVAGDSSIELMIDGEVTGVGPWNTVTWVSPNLGAVIRTYALDVPEPSSFMLVTLALLITLIIVWVEKRRA